MPATYLMMLVVAAASGWMMAELMLFLFFRPYIKTRIAGFSIQGLMPALKPVMAAKLSALADQQLSQNNLIAEKMDEMDMINRLKPDLEAHIDIFLKEKLKDAFPLLHQFMGEKTLARFKEAFLSEVELILPGLMRKSVASLLGEMQIKTLIEDQINAISIPAAEAYILKSASRKIVLFKIAAAAFGLITGIIQVAILYYQSKS
ncbi:MAG: hypothetical protein JWQ27_131 [Ferruginibacter sp.]|nr:hypothetical protein [Ferruginibacter sp.]